MKINYNMDKETFYKIALLEKQCRVYLLLASITPNKEFYFSQAVKTLKVARIIYKEWQENSTITLTLLKVA